MADPALDRCTGGILAQNVDKGMILGSVVGSGGGAVQKGEVDGIRMQSGTCQTLPHGVGSPQSLRVGGRHVIGVRTFPVTQEGRVYVIGTAAL